MSQQKLKMKVHVEVRSVEGTRRHDLVFDADSVTLYDVLVSMSQKKWGQDLFVMKEDRVSQIPGYLMVLEKRMVQQWEVDDIPVTDGNHLKFVKVVPGG
ncbi:MAG: hypothetical protein EHM41_06255 [Chloroflexi bacterium]|nr:MAG: hypothetical protein EHM41_06255 [Chloroflexota bacterium]